MRRVDQRYAPRRADHEWSGRFDGARPLNLPQLQLSVDILHTAGMGHQAVVSTGYAVNVGANSREPEMIKAVLFDLDETLVDRQSSAVEFLKVQYRELVVRQFGDAVSEEQYAARYFTLEEEEGLVKKSDLYPALVASFGLPAEASAPLMDHFRLRYPEMARPMQGALEALQALRKLGLPCAIITNGEGIVQRKKIEVTGIADLIEFALISGELGIRKPDRQIFEMAADRLSLLSAECVFIGDNATADVMGALNAGMSAVYFGDIKIWPAELPKPPRACNSLGDIVALITTLE